jgi:hypothetical protein
VKKVVGGSGWPARLRWIHNTFTGVGIATGGGVIFTSPCLLCMENQ